MKLDSVVRRRGSQSHGAGGVHSATSVTLISTVADGRAARLPVTTSRTYAAASTTFRPPVNGMDNPAETPASTT